MIVVKPRLSAAPRLGLIASAEFPELEPDWEDGIGFRPEAPTGQANDNCDPDLRDPPASAGKVEFIPFTVEATVTCRSTFDNRADEEYKAAGKRALLTCEEHVISREFWRGDIATAKGHPNNFLTNSDAENYEALTGPADPFDALACLEGALADCSCGQQGMIHASRALVSLWNQSGALRREANRIYTINDTIVVPGAGYDGSAPGFGAQAVGLQYAYATGIVEVRRSETITTAVVEHKSNSVTVWAQRLAAATWDSLCHVGIQVNVPDCAPVAS